MLHYYDICHEHGGIKKKIESPMGIEPWPPRYRLGALTTELREVIGELGHQLGHVTRALHTARI